jgi:hydrogenase maturation protein HypF
MLRAGVSSPLTTSVGRLFDAIAALLGLCQRSRFEGQAAMEVEFCVEPGAGSYHFELNNTDEVPSLSVIDWAPMLREILDDLQAGVRKGMIAGRFHNMLAETIIACAKRAGEKKVVLSGGCFQNKYLLERSVARLWEEGFTPYWHQRIPPNDGGIAVGQLYAAAMHMTLKEASAAGNGVGS